MLKNIFFVCFWNIRRLPARPLQDGARGMWLRHCRHRLRLRWHARLQWCGLLFWHESTVLERYSLWRCICITLMPLVNSYIQYLVFMKLAEDDDLLWNKEIFSVFKRATAAWWSLAGRLLLTFFPEMTPTATRRCIPPRLTHTHTHTLAYTGEDQWTRRRSTMAAAIRERS